MIYSFEFCVYFIYLLSIDSGIYFLLEYINLGDVILFENYFMVIDKVL